MVKLILWIKEMERELGVQVHSSSKGFKSFEFLAQYIESNIDYVIFTL